MTLTRPAYAFTVTNITQGWTFESTEGPAPDPVPVVVLTDGLTHSWGFTDDRVPGPFEPETLTFHLGATSVDVLPRVHIGDLIEARLVRPLEGWPTDPDAVRPYFEFSGRIGEPTLDLDPHSKRPARLTLTCTSHLTDLNGNIPNIDEGSEAPPLLQWRVLFLSELAQTNFIVPSTWATNYDPDSAWVSFGALTGLSAHDIIVTTANTSPIEYAPGERVVSYPRGQYYSGPPVHEFSPEWIGYSREAVLPFPNKPEVWYWVTPIFRRLGVDSAVLRLVWPAGSPFATIETHPDAESRDGVAYLDACLVRTPLSARKAREHMVNTIVSEGWAIERDEEGNGDPSEITRWRSREAVTEFGTVTRTVPTQALFLDSEWGSYEYQADRIAAAFMPDGSADDQPWGFDQLDICTWLMTDEELDRYAPKFWPAIPTDGDAEPRTLTQLIIGGVDETVMLGSRFLTAIVTGATHTINGGELLIQPKLIGGVLPPHPDGSDAVTAADLAAKGTPWSDLLTAETVDPDLSAVDFRLIGAPV